MKNLLKIIIIVNYPLSIIHCLHAQTLDISLPQKFGSKTPYFKVIGKNSQSIYFHKYGRGNNIIESYSDKMRLLWNKPLSLDEKAAKLQKIVVLPASLALFYTVKHSFELHTGDVIMKGQYAVLYVQQAKGDNPLTPFNKGDLQLDTSIVVLDTIRGIGAVKEAKYKIKLSDDQSKIIAWRVQHDLQKRKQIIATVLDNELNILWKDTIVIPLEMDIKLNEVLLSNSGDIYFTVSKKKSKKRNEKLWVFEYKPTPNPSKEGNDSALLKQYEIDIDNYYPGNFKFAIDQLNAQLVGSGFYFESLNEGNTLGVFYVVIDLKGDSIKFSSVQPFDPQYVSDITKSLERKYITNEADKLGTYKIKQLVPRSDGGVILVAESYVHSTRTTSIPNLYGYYTTSTIQEYFYNDIMVVSINPDGTIDWNKLLKKFQESEDDKGYYSSYSLIVNKDGLHFIFNEDIAPRTNIVQYSLDALGNLQRKTLLSAGTKNVTLIARAGKQIYRNQLLIPSVNRNNLSLVKISY